MGFDFPLKSWEPIFLTLDLGLLLEPPTTGKESDREEEEKERDEDEAAAAAAEERGRYEREEATVRDACHVAYECCGGCSTAAGLSAIAAEFGC